MTAGSSQPPDPDTRRWQDVVAEHPFLAALSLVGLLALLKIIFTHARAGDEAPIRIKNGTIDLILEKAGATWVATGNHWKTQGTRQNPTYKVTVTRKKTSACKPPFNRYQKLVVVASTFEEIEIDPAGNHTTVRGPGGRLSSDGKTLSFGSAASRIATIRFRRIGGDDDPCDYAPDDLEDVYLED